MASITERLGTAQCEKIAIVGSGGKTTLLWLLARHGRRQKTLVTTSTKIWFPPEDEYDFVYLDESFRDAVPQKGITLAGIPVGNGKLGPLAEEWVQRQVQNYDRVLIEADGAHERPLKGWTGYEPVVPSFVTTTVGVIPLWPSGHPADSRLVHRTEAFSVLTGAQMGAPIENRHIQAAIEGKQGLFQRARGKKVLLYNQVEDKDALVQAREITENFSDAFINSLDLILAGSVVKNECEVLWDRSNL